MFILNGIRIKITATSANTASVLRLRNGVFLDPNHLAVLERIEGGEERWQTLGMVCSCLLLLVAHTTIETDVEGDTVEIVRIISARKADAKERGRYEAQKFSQKSGA